MMRPCPEELRGEVTLLGELEIRDVIEENGRIARAHIMIYEGHHYLMKVEDAGRWRDRRYDERGDADEGQRQRAEYRQR